MSSPSFAVTPPPVDSAPDYAARFNAANSTRIADTVGGSAFAQITISTQVCKLTLHIIKMVVNKVTKTSFVFCDLAYFGQ